MFSQTILGVLFGTLLIIGIIPNTVSYNKYGRTCQDIGCRSDETCVMAEDPCTAYSDKCGRYPTCQRTSGASCTTMVCGENEYCKAENGAPKCVKKSTGLGYESAGVSYVNGERVSGSNVNPNVNSNVNPYANANAPPVPPYPSGDNGDHHRASYGSNLGYPPYPGSSANGYPPQSNNQAGHRPDSGYPPYPTQNRMPVPGQPVYPQNPPGNYPQQYPGYQNYPYQNYPNQPLPPGLDQVSYRTTPRVPLPPPRSSSYGGRYSGHSGSQSNDGSILSYRTTPRAPSPPPRSSSFGGRYSGHSGTRNSIGDGSIFNRLFGNDRHPRPTSRPTSRSTTLANGNNYYQTHTQVDSHGNRVWTFSG